MAINDVSLTSGMRSNLLSLQGTVDLLNRTQNRLSSGKKVNSAIDNPVSYFASQALNSRASVIDSLKDAMGQAVQTITAADKGITAITAMIEQAKGIAQSALSAETSSGFDTGTITLGAGGLAIADTIQIGATTLTAGPNAADITTYNSFTLTLGGEAIEANDTVVVGGTTFTAVTTTAATTTYDSVDVDFTNIAVGDQITIGGVAYTAANTDSGLTATQFYAGGTAGNEVPATAAANFRAAVAAHQAGAFTIAVPVGNVISITAGTSALTATSVQSADIGADITQNNTTTYAALGATQFMAQADPALTAESLKTQINSYFGTGLVAARTGNAITITAGTSGLTATTVTAGTASALEIAITSATTTSPGALVAGEFAVTGDNIIDAQVIANAINANTAITAAGYSATADNGVLTIANDAADIIAANIVVTGNMTEAIVAGSSELTDLVAQFNTMRTQIDELAEDSGYKGKNLLSNTAGLRSLDVKFEGTTLNVQGFDATTAGLNVTSATDGATTTWTTGTASINASIDQLDAALVTLRAESSQLSGNLSIITVRQDFSTNMINTLTAGADKLTLADANEEGANMLMLQTRQSLSTTALSLSAQAAQSVLKLFG